MKKKYKRMAIYTFVLILMCCFSFFAVSLLNRGFHDSIKNTISYQESSNIDYRVYLKKNDFFETPYLEAGRTYITSLIDYIFINFSYHVKFDDFITGNYTYYLNATVEANKPNGESGTYWSKDYPLTEEKTVELDNVDGYSILESLQVDYGDYNDILTAFKKQYGLSVDGNLKIKLIVKNNFKNEQIDNVIDFEATDTLSIPLTQLAMEASISTSSDVNQHEITSVVKIDDPIYLVYKIAGSVFALLAVACLVIYIKLLKFVRKANYYTYTLKKIIDNYDSIIVNISDLPDLERFHVISVNSFDELLDAHSEVRMPINFYEDDVNKISTFILINDKTAWIYVLKSKPLQKN